MSNPIKPTLKTEIFPVVLIVLSIIASVYFYFHLPARIVTHWNFAGQPDGWGSGKAHAVFFPLLIAGMYIMFLFLPYLDPKKARYEQFGKVYHVIKAIILFILAFVYFISSLSGLGYDISIAFWTPLMIGLLFIFLGNYMGKIKMNWFVGIRTPWTLSSEEVWNRSHRFGGKVFMFSGFLIMINGILPFSWRLPVFIIAIISVLFGTVGASYIFYRLEKNKKAQKSNENIT